MTDGTYSLADLCDLADVTPRTVRYYVSQGLLRSPGTSGPSARYDDGHLARLRLVRRLQREHLPLAEIRARLAALSDEEAIEQAEGPPEPPVDSALDYVRGVLGARTTKASPPGMPRLAASPSAAVPPPPADRTAASLLRRASPGDHPPGNASMLRELRSLPAGAASSPAPASGAASSPAPASGAAAAPASGPAPASGAAAAPASGAAAAPPAPPAAADARAPAPPAADGASSLTPPGPRAGPPIPEPPGAERSQWDRFVLAPDVELHVRRPLTRSQNRAVARLLEAARQLLEEDQP